MSPYDFYRAQRDDRPYCVYLRKSRGDFLNRSLPPEEQMEEILARHERDLLDLAARMGITIAPDAIFREIKSAENISGRPVMQQLLEQVEQGKWAGVFCMEVERLARGDGIDQALVVQAFKYSHTLIITKQKVYDPTNDADEDYFELGLVFSRREYKTTTRRLMTGRDNSAKEGHYLGTKDPYGFVRYNSKETGPTLKQTDEIKNAIWAKDMLLEEGIGCETIAERFNQAGLRTNTGLLWEGKRIRSMLRNPLYAGYVTWNKRVKKTIIENGKKVNKRVRSEAPILVPGVHKGAWDYETYKRIIATIESRHYKPRAREAYGLANPLSSICFCSICGKTMIRQAHSPTQIQLGCETRDCPTVSTPLSVVVDAVLDGVRSWLQYEELPPEPKSKKEALPVKNEKERLQKAIASAEKQMTRTYELMEQEIYSAEEFISRRAAIQQQLQELRRQLEETKKLEDDPTPDWHALAPQIRHVLDAWPHAATPKEQNELLKTVVARIEYTKVMHRKKSDPPGKNLELAIFPLWVSSDE